MSNPQNGQTNLNNSLAKAEFSLCKAEGTFFKMFPGIPSVSMESVFNGIHSFFVTKLWSRVTSESFLKNTPFQF